MSRRAWLRRSLLFGALGSTFLLLGAVLLDVWRAAGRFSSARWTGVIALVDLPADGTFPFPQQGVALLRKSGRLAAISLECTHLGCLVNTVDQGFFCPCHGSEFGPMGEVYSGPAPRSLPWHAVRISQGRIWIHSGKKQPAPLWIRIPVTEPGREDRT
ncbi:MAG: Rieske (2Fe-2S) protein [Geopsychrobacter sp.]|nr:Rieske (2Fe-2S) protein [Geopsychrobacter sp.]